jgi:SAM-dependent methyltransferase
MHSLDSVRSPHDLLESVGRALAPGGRAIIASPYDWHPAATPIETWLGGHSQRTPAQGAPAEVLRALLRPDAHPSSLTTLTLTEERDGIPWHVRLHDRSTMLYQTHLVVATRTGVAT